MYTHMYVCRYMSMSTCVYTHVCVCKPSLKSLSICRDVSTPSLVPTDCPDRLGVGRMEAGSGGA